MYHLVILISCCLCFYLIKFLHGLWWTPIRVKRAMNSQGVKGPPYKFIHGNIKDIIKMGKESMARLPLDLSSHDVYSIVQPHIQSWSKIYGMNFLFWIGRQAQLTILEPEIVKEILNNRDKIYVKTGFHQYLEKLFGDGLVTSEGEKWSKMRKLANYAFNSESLKNMCPTMVASAQIMLQRWKEHEGKELDVLEEFRLLTSEVISRTAFGSSYSEGRIIFEMLVKFSSLFQRNAFKFKLPGIGKLLKSKDEVEAENIEKGIREAILEIVKKREEKVRSTGEVDSYGSDFLGLLLKACHEEDESKRIRVDELIDECKTFYITGQETTNMLLSWTLLLLAIHTNWQEEARNEVLKIFGQETPNPDGITKLKVISMIINETLRLYPPISGFTRKSTREVQIGNLKIPANVPLFVSSVALHHDTKIWGKDAHVFKPERFSEGIAKATNNNAAIFLPFGSGPRSCVGMNFALFEAKIALAMILQRYAFTLSPAYVHSPCQIITLRPQHGVQVILHSL